MAWNLRKRVVLLAACGVLAMSTCALAEGSCAGGQDPPKAPGSNEPLVSPDSSVLDTLTALLPLLVQLF